MMKGMKSGKRLQAARSLSSKPPRQCGKHMRIVVERRSPSRTASARGLGPGKKAEGRPDAKRTQELRRRAALGVLGITIKRPDGEIVFDSMHLSKDEILSLLGPEEAPASSSPSRKKARKPGR